MERKRKKERRGGGGIGEIDRNQTLNKLMFYLFPWMVLI
jgi:hypothetical protein